MKHLDIIVFGKVQGVFFRASTKTKADDLGLAGWCENRKDGTVHIEVEGEESALNKFVQWCHKGPEFANVTKVRVNEESLKDYVDFEIRRG